MSGILWVLANNTRVSPVVVWLNHMVSSCSAKCFLWSDGTHAQHSAKLWRFRSLSDRCFDRASCNMCGLLGMPRALIGLSAKTLRVPSLRGQKSQMNVSLAVGSCWKSDVLRLHKEWRKNKAWEMFAHFSWFLFGCLRNNYLSSTLLRLLGG